MKKVFKLRYLLLVLIICTLMFAACDKQVPPDDFDSNTDGESVSSSDMSDSSAQPTGSDIEINAENAKSYTIIRPSTVGNSLNKAAQYLQKSFKNNGFDVDFKDDWVKDESTIPDDAYEILVGVTNRAESKTFSSGLRMKDYVIAVEGNRIIIVGGSEDATASAVDFFIGKYLINKKDVVKISREPTTYLADYDIDELMLLGQDIKNFSIVIPKGSGAIVAHSAEILSDAILLKTGYTVDTVYEKDFNGEYAIKISNDKNLDSYEYSYTSSGKAFTVSGTDRTLFYAIRSLTSSLENVKEKKFDMTPDLNKTNKMLVTSSYPAEPTLDGKLPVVLCDQKNAAAVVIDLNAADPTSDDAVIWTWSPNKNTNGFSAKNFGNRIDEAKLAYSSLLQKYVVCMTSSSGFIGIAEYPSGNKIWETDASGYGPHSIQYLPNGLVACALSGNGDNEKSEIRIYALKDDGTPSEKYTSVSLTGAHGVLWDNELGILWALGSKEIVAYEIGGTVKNPTIERIDGLGTSIKSGGHDISAIPGDPDKFLIGANTVYVYDKYENKVYTDFEGKDIIASSAVKCIAGHTDGSILRTVATNVYASHCTDTFAVYKKNASGAYEKTEYTFSNRAFYKARPFIVN